MSDPSNPAGPSGGQAAPSPAPAAANAAPTAQATPPAPQAPAAAPRRNPWADRTSAKPAPAAAPVAPTAAPDPARGNARENRALLKANKELAAAQAELAALRPQAESAARASKSLAGHAASALAELPEAWRDHVADIAGKDPAAQLEAITSLRKRGLIKPQGAPTGATTGNAPEQLGARGDNVADPDAAVRAQISDLRSRGKHGTANALQSQHEHRTGRSLDKPS